MNTIINNRGDIMIRILDEVRKLSLIRTSLFFTLFLTLPLQIQAEQSESFGNYIVHYNAFTTDNLTPAIAKQYGIQRSKKRALLNISVLKKSVDDPSVPVRAAIKATATNLNQQLRQLTLREISEQGAIYYITDTLVDNAEILQYNIDIIPEGETQSYKLSFAEQFYTD